MHTKAVIASLNVDAMQEMERHMAWLKYMHLLNCCILVQIHLLADQI